MEVSPGIKRNAVLCILKHEKQFMLLERARPPHEDHFTPLGGKIDPHESPKAAALRELREETGIELADMKYAGLLVETSPSDYNWTGFVYWAEIDMRTPPLSPEGKLAWIPYSQLNKYPVPETDPWIYRYLLEKKPFMFSAEYDADMKLTRLEEEIEHKLLYAPG